MRAEINKGSVGSSWVECVHSELDKGGRIIRRSEKQEKFEDERREPRVSGYRVLWGKVKCSRAIGREEREKGMRERERERLYIHILSLLR